MSRHLADAQAAESAAAAFLEQKGCTILHRNWRTKWCEIDIVAHRGQTVYLCEVKYRSTHRQGSGLEYITPRKLRQMRFAAELWVADHQWPGQYSLCAMQVSGPGYHITHVVKDIVTS